MIRRPPRSTLPDTLFPYTTLCRSVVDDEYERRHGALGDDFAQGLRGHRIDRRRLRSEQAELEGRLVRVLHGQPAVVAVACVGVDAEAELADVEVVGFVLVADVQADDQRSEEHTSELQSLMRISYAVFCLKKK